MVFDDFGADAFFGLEFSGRHEEVVEEAPLILIEVVEKANDQRIFEAAVAEPLADMSPIFAFDMRVII